MNLDFEQLLEQHREDYKGKKKFDPYRIAESWPESPILGNACSWFIARRLHDLDHEITLERIELVKICLLAVKNY